MESRFKMSRVRFVCIGFLIFAIPAIMSCGAVTASSGDRSAQSGNLIGNPSFEKAINNRPANWERRTYNGRGEFEYVKDGRRGENCVKLSSESGADIGWLTSVPVKPRSKYKLTGWIKTENVKAGSGKGALFNVHNIQPAQTPSVTGTKDWTRVEVAFDTGDRAAVEINCLFGGWGLSTGKAWSNC